VVANKILPVKVTTIEDFMITKARNIFTKYKEEVLNYLETRENIDSLIEADREFQLLRHLLENHQKIVEEIRNIDECHVLLNEYLDKIVNTLITAESFISVVDLPTYPHESVLKYSSTISASTQAPFEWDGKKPLNNHVPPFPSENMMKLSELYSTNHEENKGEEMSSLLDIDIANM
jgi:hypothetical protein